MPLGRLPYIDAEWGTSAWRFITRRPARPDESADESGLLRRTVQN